MKNELSTLESEVICCLRRIPAYDRMTVLDICRSLIFGHARGRLSYYQSSNY